MDSEGKKGELSKPEAISDEVSLDGKILVYFKGRKKNTV